MTGQERIKKAIKFQEIDRIPVSYDFLGESDMSVLFISSPGKWKPKNNLPLYGP